MFCVAVIYISNYIFIKTGCLTQFHSYLFFVWNYLSLLVSININYSMSIYISNLFNFLPTKMIHTLCKVCISDFYPYLFWKKFIFRRIRLKTIGTIMVSVGDPSHEMTRNDSRISTPIGKYYVCWKQNVA